MTTHKNTITMQLIVFLISLALFLSPCMAADKLQLHDEKDKINYSIGYQVGGDLKRQGVDLNAEALAQGLKDGFAMSADLLLSTAEMQEVLIALKKKLDEAQKLEQKKAASQSDFSEDSMFLAGNALKDGVIQRPSGLQYIMIKEGTGQSPTINDTITVNYRGTLINGQEFDSSFRDNKPMTLRLDSALLGWQEALPLIKEGGKIKLYIPYNLAFGETGPLKDRTVIYDIELLKVQPTEKGN